MNPSVNMKDTPIPGLKKSEKDKGCCHGDR